MLEELPGIVIFGLSSTGPCVFKRNKKQERDYAYAGENLWSETVADIIEPSQNARRTHGNIHCSAGILGNRSLYG
jgi:hypothetical protein